MENNLHQKKYAKKHIEKCTHTNKNPCTDCEGIFDSLSTLIDHTKNSHIVHFFWYETLIILFIYINYLCKLLKIDLLFNLNGNIVAICDTI